MDIESNKKDDLSLFYVFRKRGMSLLCASSRLPLWKSNFYILSILYNIIDR